MSGQLETLRAALAGRYAVERVVGQGGSATVYLAKDVALDRDVAIKVLRTEIADGVGAGRFAREIKVTAHLQHPHIVPVTESGVAGDLIFFVLPYVHGESLRALLQRTHQLDVEEAVRLTREIADGLAYAHNEGIIHRDIKPENVLLSGGHAVITDFGVAKAIATTGGGDGSTESGISVGTPLYMSPEQASGSPDIDARTDQYSLACVLYEMLAGEPPFTGPTPQAIVARHMQQASPSIRILRPGVSPALAAILERGLAKVPADRYKNVADFAAALDRALTLPADRRTRIRRVRVRDLLLAGLVVVTTWLVWQGRTTAASAPPDSGGSLPASRVAVLELQAGSPALVGFAAALTGRLTDALSAIEALTVAPRRAIVAFEKDTVQLDSIARSLDIGTFVSGRIEAENSRVRIYLQLIDAKTGAQLAATHVERDFPDRVFLVDAVADTVTAMLRATLGPTIRERRQRLQTNAAAFEGLQAAAARLADIDAQMRARDLSAVRETLDAVDSLFVVAGRLDQRWVEPIIGRGKLTEWRVLLSHAEGTPDAEAWLRQGLAHAELAVKLAPNDPQATQLRGSFEYQIWDRHRPTDVIAAEALRSKAEADLRRSLDGNPDRTRVLLTLSDLVAASGRRDEALALAQRAYESDPYLERPQLLLRRLFDFSFELGRDDAAAQWCDEGAARFAREPMFFDCGLRLMAWSAIRRPDAARARALRDAALENYMPAMRVTLQPELDLMLGIVYARAGRPDSARAILDRWRAVTPSPRGTVIPAAGILSLLGAPDAAAQLIADYAASHPAELEAMRRSRGLSAALRQDPRVMHALDMSVRR
jgi:serine/threonine-protein kinase